VASDKGPQRVSLTFVPTGEGPPFTIRVRHLLKTALRAYGLRCDGITWPAEPAAGAQASEPKGG
jgi:hypothetical protein